MASLKKWARVSADDEDPAEVRRHLEQFASAVIAKISSFGPDSPYRFGRKMFLSALSPNAATRRQLWDAHAARLLTLSRADLTPMFRQDPAQKKIHDESATTINGGLFHFVSAP